LIGAANRVEVGTMTKTRYEQLETAYGLNLNRHGLLAAEDLRFTVQCG
jgi:hypothetical protein